LSAFGLRRDFEGFATIDWKEEQHYTKTHTSGNIFFNWRRREKRPEGD
jgi:hypothetical protein